MRLYCQILLCFLSFQSVGQAIRFAEISLEAAKQRAVIEDKDIFIDTYAPWCGPCKKLNRVFQDPNVGKFFNKNFINIKVNMDGPIGSDYQTPYRIAFLPTLLFITQHGHTRYRIENLVGAKELLSIGKLALDKKKGIKKAPIKTAAKEKEIAIVEAPKPIKNDAKGEKILYVLDPNAENLPPEILYQEAYFRIELNNGTHLNTAKKYLDTQQDWSSPTNQRFIYDFLYDTSSPEFEYFINNKSDFITLVGESKVQQTLDILVNNKLFQGIPRPDFEESKSLYSYIDSTNFEQKAYLYFLGRLHAETKNTAFLELINEYYEKGYPSNVELDFMHLDAKAKHEINKPKLKKLLSELKNLDNSSQQYRYFSILALLNYKLGIKQEAADAVNEAILIADTEEKDTSQLLYLKQSIEDL